MHMRIWFVFSPQSRYINDCELQGLFERAGSTGIRTVYFATQLF